MSHLTFFPLFLTLTLPSTGLLRYSIDGSKDIQLQYFVARKLINERSVRLAIRSSFAVVLSYSLCLNAISIMLSACMGILTWR